MSLSNDLFTRVGRRMSHAFGRRPSPDQNMNRSTDDISESDNVTFNAPGAHKLRTVSSMPRQGPESLFTNFEDIRLTDEERIYLNAAAQGDVSTVRQCIEDNGKVGSNLNVNCVDYMGRNALHLAVDSENLEVIEMLLDCVESECVEEALLHAISKGQTKLVRCITEHPNYTTTEEERIKLMDFNNAFFKQTEKSQFSPDITPLILSAHYNNREMIQMFLARNHRIEKPHPIYCQCQLCQVKQDYDSLKRSRSRLNAYRALASPAYMALSSPDPIMTTFELRQEMMKLAAVEKEFKREYLMLVEQCMNFACEMMDLCRGTQEVEAVISEYMDNGANVRDPLGRLRMAIHYEEKKFVAHPNCQQYLTSIWYGSETAFLQSWSLVKKVGFAILAVPLIPLMCLAYIISSNTKLAKALRCPAVKFATSAISHFTFLFLLAAATMRLNENFEFEDEDSTHDEKIRNDLKQKLRPANSMMTQVQYGILLWVAGLLASEMKQVYFLGIRQYAYNAYNILNCMILMLYTASYTLEILVGKWVQEADAFFNATAIAHEALLNKNDSAYNNLLEEINASDNFKMKYFMEPSRFKWDAADPEIVSDVLFAIANVISFARTTYLMPAFEILGPLQISFARILTDITRFLVLFILVLVAFMVGLHNLYWYYGTQRDSEQRLATEMFEGLSHTFYSLFWSMFGQISLSRIPVRHPNNSDYIYEDGMIDMKRSTAVVEMVGMFLLALYHVIIIIVLVNMLIAMMSHTFEGIQVDCDVEWKFARTKLWLTYIDKGSTLPVPFNLIPTPRSCLSAVKFARNLCSKQSELNITKAKSTQFIQIRRDKVCKEKNIIRDNASYSDIMQRLIRRYLFKMEREVDVEEKIKEYLNGRAEESIDAHSMVMDDHGGGRSGQYGGSFGDNDSLSYGAASHRKGGAGSLSRKGLGGGGYGIGGGGSTNRRMSLVQSGNAATGGGGGYAGQPTVFSLPQLATIQKSQKFVDMRLQNLQAQSEELNKLAGNSRLRQEIQQSLELVAGNQSALFNIVNTISQIQEQVCLLNNNMQDWVIAQAQARGAEIQQKKKTRVIRVGQ